MGPIILTVEILFGLALFMIPGVGIGVGFFYFIILIFAGVVIVKPQTVRAKEVFGKYTGIIREGLNFVVPFVTVTIKQELDVKTFPVEVKGITNDKVDTFVLLNVMYYIIDDENITKEGNIYKSIYLNRDPKTMIRSVIEEQLRSMITSFSYKDIFNKKEEIGHSIEERLREKLSQFGYKIDSIQVIDIKLDQLVMAAMSKVIETENLKEAAYNEAEAQKIMQIKQAEAEKESKILLGEGMAGQRFKIAVGFKESVEMIKSADTSLNAKDILNFLLDSSRIETLGNIGAKDNSKLIYLNEDLEGRSGLAREKKLIAGSDIMK